MSRKLVTLIQDIKGLPGKYKRVLQAWASFANNDGTNIFASKGAVAARAGVSRWTVYENTDALEAAGVLLRTSSHVCKTEKCNKGGTHFTSQHGHYTTVYRLDVALLENPTALIQKLADPTVVKPRNGTVGKSKKGTVVKPDATQALEETPAPLSKTEDSSALTSGKEVREGGSSLATLTTEGSVLPQPEILEPFGLETIEQEASQDQGQPLQESEYTLWRAVRPVTKGDPLPAELRAMREVVATCLTLGIDPLNLLDYNRSHKSGKYVIRTFRQFAVAIEGNEDGDLRLLNEYMTHDRCKQCQRADDSRIQTFKERNSIRLMEEAEAQRKAQVVVETQRLAQLSVYNFEPPTEFANKTLGEMREPSWVAEYGKLNKAISDGFIDREIANAAINWFAAHPPFEVTWDMFTEKMDEITMLRQPMSMAAAVGEERRPGFEVAEAE